MLLDREQFLEFVCGKNEAKKYYVEFKNLGENSYKAFIKLKFYDLKLDDNTIAILNLNNYYCVLEWQKGVKLNSPVDMTEEYRRFVVFQLLKRKESESFILSYLNNCKLNLINERKERYFE